MPPGNLLRFDHDRSEEHTSELQSHVNLVCRLLLEKKKRLSTAVVEPKRLVRPRASSGTISRRAARRGCTRSAARARGRSRAARRRFFCNGAGSTEIYTLSLHDALPIYS